MTGMANRFAEEAQRLTGVPFRWQGRNRSIGVDCVGLVALALEAAGIATETPRNYSMRQSDIGGLLPLAKRAGFVAMSGAPQRGDILLVRPGPGQHHLMVCLETDHFVHAHAGLRIVAEQVGPLTWPILQHWRLQE